MNNLGIIVVAGGSGSRMGGALPKQFMPLGAEGKPVLVHTLERLVAALPAARIVIALPAHELERWSEISLQYGLAGTHTVCAGGETRFASVQNALATLAELAEHAELGALGSYSTVAVHDGVRPLVSAELIGRLRACAEQNGSAIPVVTPVDSFREIVQDAQNACPPEGNEARQIQTQSVDRGRLLAVQTPQVFDYHLLVCAYQTPYNERFTDDASVVEHSGTTLTFCAGERTNLKITTPEDIVVAEALIRAGY